ncbi:hypothetical protein CEXT_361131 [Caerostris extrusa]|uniref:Uncharacterized protein n=1 Tax=Caerostris extrusa TaxID=172846 RepID=A0AAV4MIY2_CAEEX|nr:hypothetical protein CEXT_361131 [Caerostris extrusa]
MTNTYSSYSGHQNKNHLADDEVILFRMFYFVGLVFPVDLKSTFLKTLFHKLLEHGATVYYVVCHKSLLPRFKKAEILHGRCPFRLEFRQGLGQLYHLHNPGPAYSKPATHSLRISHHSHLVLSWSCEEECWILHNRSSANQRRGNAFQILPGVLQQCLRMHVSDGTGLLTAAAACFRIRPLLHVQCHHVLDDSECRQRSDISTDRASSPALCDGDWVLCGEFPGSGGARCSYRCQKFDSQSGVQIRLRRLQSKVLVVGNGVEFSVQSCCDWMGVVCSEARLFEKKTTSGIVTYAVLLSQLGKQAAPK